MLSRIQNLFRIDSVDPESRNRVLLIGGLVLVVAFALGLIAYGYYVDRVKPNTETVFTVGERKFSYSYLQDRVEAAYTQSRFDTSNFTVSLGQLVADIENEELTRLIAKEDSVTATDEEVDAAMKDDLGLSPEASQITLASALRSRLKTTGLSLGQYEEMIKASALKQKLTDQIQAGLPSELEQVELNVILVDTDAAAVQARQRIVDGEDFGEVAKDVSQHTSASDGGALGWTPKDLLVDQLADAAFSQEIGALSDIIETDNGFYIIRVDGKETRELEETTKVRLARSKFADRLQAATDQYEIQNLVTVGQAQRIADHLQKVSVG